MHYRPFNSCIFSCGIKFHFYILQYPIAVVEGEFIDGCSVELEVEEDTKYKFLIKTIGNKHFLLWHQVPLLHSPIGEIPV